MKGEMTFQGKDVCPEVDPLDKYWTTAWRLTLRDGQVFGYTLKGSDLVQPDLLLESVYSELFAQVVRVIAELARDGHDVLPTTLEYEEAKVAKALEEGRD